jgi:hypothetical protein
LDARLTTLLCKKPKEVKTACNLAEYSKEGCGKMVIFANDDKITP